MKNRNMANGRGRELSRASSQERGASRESMTARERQQSSDPKAVCCDENLVGAERFARKGDDDDLDE